NDGGSCRTSMIWSFAAAASLPWISVVPICEQETAITEAAASTGSRRRFRRSGIAVTGNPYGGSGPAVAGAVVANQIVQLPDVRAVALRIDEERRLHRHQELNRGIDADQPAVGIHHRAAAVAGLQRDVDLERPG